MPFFYIRNAKDQNVFTLHEPWNFDTSRFPFDRPTDRYKAWWKSEKTDGCLLSLNACDYEEGAYGTRVDAKENPPRVIYGLSADYDHSFVDEDYVNRLKLSLPHGCEYAPQWAAISQGNHLHLFWLFETPVHFIDLAHAKAFIHYAMEKVKAKLFGVNLADYDSKASECPTQYIDIGKQWIPMATDVRISTNVLRNWSTDVAFQTLGTRTKNTKIPLERADELIRKLYPTVDLPALTLGMRCRRFWDDSADNDTAACVMEDGFLVFTPHDNGFKSWTDLFGAKAVDEVCGATKGQALEDFVYVAGRHSNFYHRYYDDQKQEKYEPIDREFVKMLLREAGYSGQRPKHGNGNTEVEKALITIINTRRVASAGPYLYFRPGIIHDPVMFPEGGFLNTSTVTPYPPNADPELFNSDYGATWENPDAANSFPFLYQFLTFLFCESREEFDEWQQSGRVYLGSRNKQLMIFLSWLSHFYKNSYKQSSSVGQALYLVGPPGCGKSFLSAHVIPMLMGGQAASGEQYFLQGGTFTREIAERPVITLDDVMPPNEYNSRDLATQRIKSFVASGMLKYEPKGHDACTIPYRGRLICSSNTTPRDLSILPSLDSGNRDKFIMLRIGGYNLQPGERCFLNADTRQDTIQKVRHELGAFARFLLAFEIPEDLKDQRYGVIGYQEDSLSSAAVERGNTGTVLTCLANWMLTLSSPSSVRVPGSADGDKKYPGLLEGLGSSPRVQSKQELLAEALRQALAAKALKPLRLTATSVYRSLSLSDPFLMKGLSVNSVQYALTQISSHEAFAAHVRVHQTGAGKQLWSIDFRFLFDVFGQNFEYYDETDSPSNNPSSNN